MEVLDPPQWTTLHLPTSRALLIQGWLATKQREIEEAINVDYKQFTPVPAEDNSKE